MMGLSSLPIYKCFVQTLWSAAPLFLLHTTSLHNFVCPDGIVGPAGNSLPSWRQNFH